MARSAGMVRCWKGGAFIVKNEVCDGKRLSVEESTDFLEGGDVGRCRPIKITGKNPINIILRKFDLEFV